MRYRNKLFLSKLEPWLHFLTLTWDLVLHQFVCFWHSGLYSKEGLRRIEWHGVPIITCRNCFWFWTCMSIKLVEKTRDLKRQICQLSTEQVDAWTFGQHCRHDGTFVLHLFVNFLQYNCYNINKSILWYQFIIFFSYFSVNMFVTL